MNLVTLSENQKTTHLKRMIIVDDEPIICEGLRRTIDWAKLGVEVIDIAYDGEDAIEILEQHPIDIILTDIRMDGMDGISLAEQIYYRYPTTKVIIISGYEDFGYAKRVMKFGVSDYLLKPVNIDELELVVTEAVSKINQSLRENDELWFSSIVSNGKDNKTYATPQRFSEKSTMRVIAGQILDYSERYGNLQKDERDALHQNWIDSIKAHLFLSGCELLFQINHQNLLYIFVSEQNKVRTTQEWINELTQVQEKWSFKGKLLFTITNSFTDIEQTVENCMRAKDLLMNYSLYSQMVITEENSEEAKIIRTKKSKYVITQEWLSTLLTHLYQQNEVEIETVIKAYVHELKELKYSSIEIVKLYEEHKVLIKQRLRSNNILLDELSTDKLIDTFIYNTYESIEKAILKEMLVITQLIATQTKNKNYWIVEKAMNYVANNYSEDLKASEVASWLNITPNHFSNVFKQKTGMNFKEYLNEIRIQHAQRLLANTNDKVFEIANLVGYKEYKYFVSVFKLNTGVTPKEYRTLNSNRGLI